MFLYILYNYIIMKKFFVFLLGFFCGIVFTIIAACFIAINDNVSNSGMTFFEQPGECLSTKDFMVLQAQGDNHALAYEKGEFLTGLLVLVTNDDGMFYYDQQEIKVPKGKCMRQIGVYRYQSNSEIWKTVPIVKIMDK